MSSCPVSAEASEAASAGSRKRIPTACEACRVAKIRCLPSDQPGVCQKCLVSKKECVSRTGPRRRRPNRSKLPLDNDLPPPPKPSGTFTIDIPLTSPYETPSSSSVDTLRESHAAYLDNLFPASPLPPPSPFPFHSSNISSASSFSFSSASSPSTTTTTTAVPRFNTASAERLLARFRGGMLRFGPCVLLPADVSVRALAAARPFVLLAVLAAAAGAQSLQGHNLYDDEFRRVFALKLVAGGERSLELLQGLLVYCLWYPFHLRPRVRQVFQYTRMAADLVHDLELDVDPGPEVTGAPMTPERLDAIRAYVAQHYLSSSFAVTWQAYRSTPVPFTAWTEHCCHLLAQHAACPGDAVLASLARLGRTVRDAWAAVRDSRHGDDDSSSSLVFRGLEAQFQDQKTNLPAAVANTCNLPPPPSTVFIFILDTDTSETVPIRLQTLFTEFFLLGGSILRMPTAAAKHPHPHPHPHQPSAVPADPFRPTHARLTACVDAVARFLALLTASSASLAHFCTGDWGRLVLAVVVAMRLSFPLAAEYGAGSLDWDSAWARDRLGFAAFLEAMTADTGTDLTTAAKRADVVSASKVVIAVVKEKYEKRLAALLRQQQEEEQEALLSMSKCPMLDGSLDRYFPLWDGSVGPAVSMPSLSFMEGMAEGDDDDALLDAWADEALDWMDPEDLL